MQRCSLVLPKDVVVKYVPATIRHQFVSTDTGYPMVRDNIVLLAHRGAELQAIAYAMLPSDRHDTWDRAWQQLEDSTECEEYQEDILHAQTLADFDVLALHARDPGRYDIEITNEKRRHNLVTAGFLTKIGEKACLLLEQLLPLSAA